jgi:hypothetical protein
LNPGSKWRTHPWQFELALLLFAILVVIFALQDANEIALFSPIRHVPEGAPFVRNTLQGSTLPAVLALKGINASEEFTDYRGVRVVAQVESAHVLGVMP